MEKFEDSHIIKPIREADSSRAEASRLSKLERNRLRRRRKREAENSYKKKQMFLRAVKIGLTAVILGTGAFVFGKFLAGRPDLPPVSAQGHIESSPPAHITAVPMPEVVQKHMLEHADGAGRPGIIIQYNCADFECQPDLVEKLSRIVKDYPEHVYLAPNNYAGKIILTRIGQREILDEFDEGAIRNFIEK